MAAQSHAARRPGRALAALALAAAGGLLAAATVGSGPAGAAGTTLRDLAEAKGSYFGTALTQSNLNSSTITAIAGAQFDVVTPGNEMKWDTTEPSAGNFNFGPGDQIVSFAKAHSMRVRGHTLVWHSQLPSWVGNLPANQVQAAMENHVTTEATHYKGQVYSWDVVNEPFNEDGTLRADAFYNAMGTGYIADALRTAHAADPNAKLYLNDYNIEGLGAKSDAMYQLVSSLKQQGVPIDGVGFESHFIVGQVPGSLKANIQRFTALGVNVAITELDDRMPVPASAANLAQQATDYAYVVNSCLAVAGCVGVSQWGVGDPDSWIPDFFSGYGAATMYDANYQPKAAYNAVVTALGGTGSGSPSPSASASASASSSPSPSTSVPPAGAGCKVSAQVSAWNTGLTENITVTNTGASAVNGWRLAFTLPGGQTVTNAWNATVSPAGGQVGASNLAYNAAIPAGGSTSFGFQADHTGNAAAATGFTLNGVACSAG
ncbi:MULTISPECIES: endo-1,4-beta-xylanase [Kitasatospora]|uniref:Beta-xylanase n=1 Tax=Kitasatospora setae (strain ATCC 33774 / DSM 43861 / JCM 3304 / KCC A-0304 / NBRC 14216 / KM-6054) TaxID=452652 RepID=E4N6Z2_KITSK|nr:MULTISPECIES: endo-1,4-beta-xylanase [Kitasatospora]BAJ26973.1 putative endo-1,4-beta-xylanase A precursor [Kitasatospora setae KM-6054]